MPVVQIVLIVKELVCCKIMILVDGIRVKDIFKVSHLLKLSWLHWKRLYFKLKPVGNVKFFLG